ncbi:DUF4846 domain-containing protein [Microscilla marina]|nr:DUF4846 domain-containing protein [Microscilla marina]
MKYIVVSLLLIVVCVLLMQNHQNISNNDAAGFALSNAPKKIKEIALPAGYQRVTLVPSSFGSYLRNLPLKSSPTVYLYNGHRKRNQQAQYAVLDVDVGKKNLQQCADAVIRLRAEYLYKNKLYSRIQFHFTNGSLASYAQWCKGFRAKVRGNKVRWVKTHGFDESYATFRQYLETVFMYAGSYSLNKELQKVPCIRDIQVGDVFIQGGFPGHAVLVVDVARHSRTGVLLFMLAQSYMPAQDIHILKNLNNKQLNPWYSVAQLRAELETPEWTFKKNNLKRF